MEPEALLNRVLDSERAYRVARDEFLGAANKRGLVQSIGKVVDAALANATEVDSRARLVCVSDLLIEIGNAESTQLLLKILAHEDPAVRVSAGEGLVELLYEKYGEVARTIEAEIDRGMNATALAEIPFILAEVGEPGGVKIVSKLLKHESADVVGAAIEALAAMGDPSVLKSIEALRKDTRKVSIEEDEAEGEDAPVEVTLGELAGEAIEHLKRIRAS